VNIDITKRPDLAGIQAAEAAGQPVALPIMLDFVAQAHLSSSAHSVTLRFPEKMGDVIMTVERPGQEPFSVPLNAGERSQEFAINRSSSAAGGAAGDSGRCADALALRGDRPCNDGRRGRRAAPR
jgi:hypothetical protein